MFASIQEVSTTRSPGCARRSSVPSAGVAYTAADPPRDTVSQGAIERSVGAHPARARPDRGSLRVIRELTADCVHCGFCLPTCPTYVLWNEEMDSPRGRIHLMDARLDEAVTLNDTVTTHFDRCLGCMACVSSCPSGVRYDRLIEPTRAAVEEEYDRPLGDRILRGLLFRVLPYPGRMRAALALAPLGKSVPLPRRFRPLVEVAPPWRGRGEVASVTCPEGVAAWACGPSHRVRPACGLLRRERRDRTRPRGRRLRGGRASAGLLRRALDSCRPRRGGKGVRAEARSRAFENVEVVVVNSSGCGSHLKELGWLLGDERAVDFAAKVRDVGEFLAEVRPQARRHPLPLKVALQDSCHLRHAQGLPLASLGALGRIPALEVVEPAEQDICCGSAGIYNVVQPEAARELGDRKAAHVLATGAQAYASANPGCLVQVSAGLAPRAPSSSCAPSDRARRRVDPERRRRPVAQPGAALGSSTGLRSSSRSTRASDGNRRHQRTAIAIVATPPKRTAGTAPTSAAATPDSNAPSSFEALMKTISTAFTRPAQLVGRDQREDRRAEDDADQIEGACRARARASRATSRARGRRRPCTRRSPPRPGTASGPLAAGRDAVRGRARQRTIPPPGQRAAARGRSARPRGCPSRRSGRSATAPPSSTAKRSREIAPSKTFVRRMRRTPASTSSRPAAPPPRQHARHGARARSQRRRAKARSRPAYTSSGWSANRRPPTAGPATSESWNAMERCASALTRISRGTSEGVRARPAGAPIALPTPIANASAKNGHTWSAPESVIASSPSATPMSTTIMKR